MKKLTEKQILAALKELHNGWPDGLGLYANGGTIVLYDTEIGRIIGSLTGKPYPPLREIIDPNTGVDVSVNM